MNCVRFLGDAFAIQTVISVRLLFAISVIFPLWVLSSLCDPYELSVRFLREAYGIPVSFL